MCLEVALVLGGSPFHISLLRSAGTYGAYTVDEVASRGRIPIYTCEPIDGSNANNDDDGSVVLGRVVPIGVGPTSNGSSLPRSAFVSVEACAPLLGDLPPTSSGVSTLTHYNTLRELTELVWELAPTNLHLGDGSNISSPFRSIPDRFLKSCFNISNITFSHHTFEHITHIGANFCGSCTTLSHIDLSPLSGVHTIGDDFMKVCGLLSLDLSPLVNLRHIGANFLSHCYHLTSLDVSPLHRLVALPDGFLCRCKSFEVLDLSPLQTLTTIGSSVLIDCHNLSHIQLSPLPLLTSIGGYFLHSCHSLQELHISRPTQITQIGPDFVNECLALKSASLEGLEGILDIPAGFMCSCTSLREVDLTLILSTATTVGDRFMVDCPLLPPPPQYS